MRWSKKVLIGASIVSLSLSACGFGGDGADAPEDGTSTVPPEAVSVQNIDPNREAPAEDVEGATFGGTISVLSATGLTTIDPTEAYYVNALSILSGLVTRSLTQYVYDPAVDNMVLVPDIATDTGQPNADFTAWRFTIRDGVKYEDGTPVTAQDVAYGIQRSFDRETFPSGASYSNDYFLDGDTYQGPYRSGLVYEGVTVKDETLTIKMARPFPGMPYWAAFPAIGPIPERGSEPTTYASHPLSTGPYKIDQYQPGVFLSLVRNDQWSPDTDPGRHQYVDGYEFDFTEQSKRIDSVLLADSGKGQTALTFDNLLAEDYIVAQEEAADRLVLGSSPCTSLWYPDYREITEISVRQAIGYAYPYQEAWTSADDIVGVTRIAGSTILPPGFPARQDYSVLDTVAGESDPEMAMQLLADAGYRPGAYELKFLYARDDPTSVEVKNRIVAGLEAGGFKATPVASTLNDIPTLRADPDYRKINIRSGEWCSDWPSGDLWFPPLFRSDGSNNYAHFNESAIDDEIDQILELPIEDRVDAWGALDESIESDYYPAINIGHAGVVMMRGSRIGGMQSDATLGMPTWKDLYVED